MSLLTLNPDSGVNSVLIAVQWCHYWSPTRTVVNSGLQCQTVVYSARQCTRTRTTVPTQYPHVVPTTHYPGTHYPAPAYVDMHSVRHTGTLTQRHCQECQFLVKW